MPFGYTGTIARINLQNKTYTTESWGETFYRKFLGGRNFVSYIMNKEVNPQCDPFSAENKIIIATSPKTSVQRFLGRALAG